jgi:hypothetical protein
MKKRKEKKRYYLSTPLPIFFGKKSCNGDHFLLKTRKIEREREDILFGKLEREGEKEKEKEKFSGKLLGSFFVGRRLLRLWSERASERTNSLSQRNGDARGKAWLHRISRAVEEVCVRAGVCGEGRGGKGGRGKLPRPCRSMLTMVSSVVFFYWKQQWQSGDDSSFSSSSLCNGGFYCFLFFSSLVFLAMLGCSCSCSLLLTPIRDHQLPEAASARVFTSVLQQFSSFVVVVVVVVIEEFFAVSSSCRGNAAISFQEKDFSPRLSRLDTRFPTFVEANSGNVRKRRKKESLRGGMRAQV